MQMRLTSLLFLSRLTVTSFSRYEVIESMFIYDRKENEGAGGHFDYAREKARVCL